MKQQILWMTCAVCSMWGSALPAAAATSDITRLVGEWKGHGTYEGGKLSLTREWSLDLGGRFVRADMRVLMSNGQTFRSLAFWQVSKGDSQAVVWMDEMGRLTNAQAAYDAKAEKYVIEYVDEFADDGPAPRRWEFEITGDDRYVEWVLGKVEDGWERLAEFSFERVKSK